ncbi:MAG: hypothetical protein WA624_06570, partial [Methylocella sp.]
MSKSPAVARAKTREVPTDRKVRENAPRAAGKGALGGLPAAVTPLRARPGGTVGAGRRGTPRTANCESVLRLKA